MALDPSDIADIKRAIQEGIAAGVAGAAGGGGGGGPGTPAPGGAPPMPSGTITDDDIRKIEVYQQRLLQLKQTEEVRIQVQAQEVKIAEKRLAQALQSGTATAEELQILQDIVKAEKEKLERIKTANAEREKSLNILKNIGKEVAGSLQIYQQHPLFNAQKIAEVGKAFLNAGVKGVVPFISSLATGIVSAFVNNIIGLLFEMDEAESTFKRATGASAAMAREMSNLYERNRLNTVGLKESREAFTELYTGMSSFTMISAEARAEVSDMVVVLARQGVALKDASASLETFTKMMGQTAEEAARSLSEISALAVDLGVAPAQLAADFAKIGPELAKLGADGEKAFKDLARASKNTGLEMSKLLQITNKFDTFEGAATQAGQLNAALGGNFVNAMDLMTETDPVARFEMLRGSIEDAGLSFDDMSYYQRQFFANALGLSDVGDLALMLSGDMSALGDQVGMTSADYEAQAERTQQLATLTDKFKAIIAELTPTLLPVLDKLHEWTDNLLQNDDAINKLKADVELFLKPFKTIGDILGHLIRNWPVYLGILVTYKVLMMGLTAVINAKALAERAAGLSTNLAQTASIRQLATMKRAVPVFLAMGAAVLMVGAGFALAAIGAGFLAQSLKGLSGGEMAVLIVILVLLGVGVYLLAKFMLAATIPTGAFATAMMGLGFAIMLVGIGIAIAAYGFSLLVTAIGEAGAGPLLAFAVALYAMAAALGAFNLALIALANPLALAGMTAFGAMMKIAAVALGVLAVILGIIMIPMKQMLIAINELAQTDIGPMASGFERIASAIGQMGIIKLFALRKMLQASEEALKAAEAAGYGVAMRPAGGTAPAAETRARGGGGGGGATNQTKQRITIPITLQVNDRQFGEAVIEVVDGAGYEAATGRR